MNAKPMSLSRFHQKATGLAIGWCSLVSLVWMEHMVCVVFGPSRSKRFGKAVAEAQTGADECSEVESGRFRASFLLGVEAAAYTGLARLLERVRHWRATEVYERNELVSSFHAKDIRVSGCPKIGHQPPPSHEPPHRRFNRGQAAVLCAAVAARIRPRAPRCGLFGAEAPLVIAAIAPVGDPETMELLANAADTEAIMADLEERAAEGDQSAKDCLAAKTGAAA
jgi:hypothetical protein